MGEQSPQVGNVPLAVAQLVNELVHCLFGGDLKSLIESAVGGPDAQGGVENQQGFAHRINDVQGVVLNVLNQRFSFHGRHTPIYLPGKIGPIKKLRMAVWLPLAAPAAPYKTE